MSDLNREEFVTHLERVHDGIQGVHDRLDKLNDRTRASELKIAVLEDRSESLRCEATTAAKKTAGLIGLALAGVGALAELVHQWWF